MKRLLSLAALATCILLSGFRVEAQDDQYLRIYTLIQEGDALRTAERQPQALAKYLDAQTALQRFQRVNPTWNEKVVDYRLNYLAARIREISSKVPAAASAVIAARTNAAPSASASSNAEGPKTPVPTTPSDVENQLSLLRGQVQQLQMDKTMLEARLKEALGAQPAAVDPRELARAQEQIKLLQKENDLIKVNLAQRPTNAPADARVLTQLRQQLDEANRRLAEQSDKTTALALEKSALQNKLNSLLPASWNATNIASTSRALEEANRRLNEQSGLAARLTQEKEALQARVKALTADAEAAAALRAENEILKKQLAELKNVPAGENGDAVRELAAVRVQLAALQSDKEILRLEKIALENRLKKVAAAPAPTLAAANPDTTRIRQLETERDDLQKKLDAAQKELSGRNTQNAAGRVGELTAQVEILRTRLSVLDAQKVPYTAEELALFQKPETSPADPRAGRKSVRELPPGSVALVAEAQRDFAARRLDSAEQKYLQVLRQDEKNVYTLANLAAIQLEMNHLDEAEKHVKQALEAAPDDTYSLSILGFLRFRQNRYDEALDVLGRAAKLDPQNPEVQNYLGLTLSQKGLRVPAETALRKAIELDPNYGGAHYNLAVIYITQKPPSTEMARLHYKKALAAGVARNADLEKLLNPTDASNR